MHSANAAADLKQRWRKLQRATLSPSRLGEIARAALILNGIRKLLSLRKLTRRKRKTLRPKYGALQGSLPPGSLIQRFCSELP